jgi:hypothetical protein
MNKKWIPRIGETFYYIFHTFENKLYVQDVFFNGCEHDIEIIKNNRVWQYKKEATLALKAIKKILKG